MVSGGEDWMSAPDSETLVRRQGRAGRITLNRPKALNALKFDQIAVIDQALDQWAGDAAVELVILDGAGDRGLCAGGDVRELYDARAGGPDFAETFWRDEYRLNAKIHTFAKPFVAIMDGIVMGGGIGLSAHASHRIVTERSQLAMPETTIGLVPDVGGTLLLARAPGALGLYLGLAGQRMGAADALYAGFADSHVATGDLESLLSELCDPAGDPIGATIAEYAAAPAPALHAQRQSDIDRLFGAGAVAEIMAALAADTATDWAAPIAEDLKVRSPLALVAAHRAISQAGGLATLEDALAVEFRLTNRFYRNGEMIEGVRALIIEKDRAPKWRYRTVEDVDLAEVDRLLAPGEDVTELTFPER